jgi:HK97 family phage major capsid protein
MTPDSLEARNAEIKQRLADINAEYAGQALPEGARTEWDTLNEERDENTRLAAELRARVEQLESLAADDDNTEAAFRGKSFQTRRPNAVRNEDVYDLTEYRRLASDPAQERSLLIDGAKRSAEREKFPHENNDRAASERHIEKLLTASPNRDPGVVARLMLSTGSPVYQRAFGKALTGMQSAFTTEEANAFRAAFAVGTAGSSAAIPVPYVVDPTIVPTSNGQVNPVRQVARVESITGTIWRGATSGEVTVAYAAEAAEATDNTPTLAQPEIQTERAQAFIPFSIESDQDWGGLQAEMAKLIQDGKDAAESAKFFDGAGHGSNVPLGLFASGAGVTTVTTASGGAFVIGDVYKLQNNAPPRFRNNLTFMTNLGTINRIRQFDTAGGAGLVAYLTDPGQGQAFGNAQVPFNLLGRNLYEWSAINSTDVVTTGTKIAIAGDFSYYCIVDRVGLSIEVIPHLFGGTANYPTGQRGLYAFFRNSAEPLSAAAFRILQT